MFIKLLRRRSRVRIVISFPLGQLLLCEWIDIRYSRCLTLKLNIHNKYLLHFIIVRYIEQFTQKLYNKNLYEKNNIIVNKTTILRVQFFFFIYIYKYNINSIIFLNYII